MEMFSKILTLTAEHLALAYGSLAISILAGIALAVASLYNRKLAVVIITLANLVEAIPSFAVVALVVPLMGIGFRPAIVAILFRALLPIIKNTYIGLKNVDAAYLEAAKGIGLTNFQILKVIRFPHAYPPMFAGIKFAAILTNGIAVLTAIIGSGGLGKLVFEGLASFNVKKIIYGIIPVMLISLATEVILTLAEKKITPAALRKQA
ncbi:MAG: ABC transporter permease [Actinomycetota bacterium]|nr:ABC transporter permease [Actinomycetota bacterium]